LGFQEYSFDQGTYIFVGFDNFAKIFRDFKSELMLSSSIKNSLTLFIWTFIFGSFGAVLFSYYIYKKNVGSELFKIVLYLPHILGSVVVVIMYEHFVERAIPTMFGNNMLGLLSNSATRRTTIIFFAIYMSFGPRVLVYTSAMSGSSESIIESAQLDGITPMKELIFIVLPSIWSTFVTFMVSSVIGIFTHQMALVTFYGMDAPPALYTFGYYLYRGAKVGTNVEYPYLAAMGLMLTAVAVPMTFLVRWGLKKLGPSKD
jgi:ABC-type sugar transport system permease subunit